MAVRRLDNVNVIVEDLDAAIAFFEEVGLQVEGRARVEGPWVDRIIALEGAQSDIVMMRTPDGHSRLELTRFLHPPAVRRGPPDAPVNTLGLGRLMFAVDDLREVLGRLQARGAELLGEVVQYEQSYLLCYVRGPEGLMIALAEELGD